MGFFERGVVGVDVQRHFIDASNGREISLNINRSDLRSYERAENDLHILLADGRVIVLEDYFGSGGSRLFLSTDGVLSEVAFAEGDGGALFAQYADVAAWGKWSPDDSLIFFDRAEVVAADYVAAEDEGGVSMLAAGLLAGSGMLPWLAGGAAVATGAAVIGGSGEGGGGGGELVGNNGESGGPRAPTGHGLAERYGISYVAAHRLKTTLMKDLRQPGNLLRACICTEELSVTRDPRQKPDEWYETLWYAKP